MKKKVLIPVAAFAIAAMMPVFGATETTVIDKTIVKTLETNTSSNPIVAQLSLEDISIDSSGNVTTKSMVSKKFTVKCKIDSTDLLERISYAGRDSYEVEFVLSSSKPLQYSITRIEGLPTSEEFLKIKPSLEKQRTANMKAGYGKLTDRQVLKARGLPNMISIPDADFSVSETEVTQWLYEYVMGENPCTVKGENFPVESVSLHDAMAFCNILSEIMGLEPVYAVDGSYDVADWNYLPHRGGAIAGAITPNFEAIGFRLPRIVEWQQAAKGGENYKYAGSDDLNRVGWFASNSDNLLHEVGLLMPNKYGLYDMCGNIWELCWGFAVDANTQELVCPVMGGHMRGRSEIAEINTSNACAVINERYSNIGFRIVRTNKSSGN